MVYGHHPIYTSGEHRSDSKVKTLAAELLPVLKGRVDVYLAGHDHDLEHLRADGIDFFVAGGGGAEVRQVKPNERSIFARSTHGFLEMFADDHQLVIRFFDTELRSLEEPLTIRTK